MTVSFHSQAEIESGTFTAPALISIVGTANDPAALPHRLFGSIHRMQFDDVPFTYAWSQHPGSEVFVGLKVEQFAQVISFAKQHSGRLAVHCLQGKSRSTAIALAILADRLRDPAQAVNVLLKNATRRIMPNPGIVHMAETELVISGLDAHLLAECPDYRWWKSKWIAEGWAAPSVT